MYSRALAKLSHISNDKASAYKISEGQRTLHVLNRSRSTLIIRSCFCERWRRRWYLACFIKISFDPLSKLPPQYIFILVRSFFLSPSQRYVIHNYRSCVWTSGLNYSLSISKMYVLWMLRILKISQWLQSSNSQCTNSYKNEQDLDILQRSSSFSRHKLWTAANMLQKTIPLIWGAHTGQLFLPHIHHNRLAGLISAPSGVLFWWPPSGPTNWEHLLRIVSWSLDNYQPPQEKSSNTLLH